MKIKSAIAAICLSLSLSASADISSTLGVSVGVILTDEILARINPDARLEVSATGQGASLLSTGAIAAISLVIADGLDYLSSNKKTERLDLVLNELRENEELKDMSDEELTVLIVSLADLTA